MLQVMGSQRVGHDLETEQLQQNQKDYTSSSWLYFFINKKIL